MGHENIPISPTPRSPGGHEIKKDAKAGEELALARSTDHKTGLSTAQVETARATHGFNELAEKKVNPILQFLGYLCVSPRARGRER